MAAETAWWKKIVGIYKDDPEFEEAMRPGREYRFDDSKTETIVNVASVPQRSPFRYPGGKTWLVPRLRRWLLSLPRKPANFIEPFAGGGIISLTVAFENLAEQVTMVELDADVAAVWQTILDGDARWLADTVLAFPFTPETVAAELARPATSLKERAFQTLLKNRTHHGGILAPGSGRIKHGENGKGLASRWYPQTLRSRILNIEKVAHKIRFLHADGLQALNNNADQSEAVFFIDPPYTASGKKAGARLYTYNELDHEELFRIAETLKGDFLMTYDNAEGVQCLADQHGFATLAIPMKNTHHAKLTELLIGRDLCWV
ncbi:MAG TPA: DNA adenine methylase [Chthonomonadaceae bacterium]|nr:DNA adenine methylase [Chthonomonadaceae bacterium]